nr:unnamed protein product [Digitaria exilis]
MQIFYSDKPIGAEHRRVASRRALIMPALCFLNIARNKATRSQVMASVATVVLGAVCGVLGTYNAVTKIAENY